MTEINQIKTKKLLLTILVAFMGVVASAQVCFTHIASTIDKSLFVGTTTTSVVGDFNHDGRIDSASSSYTSSDVSVFLRDNNGVLGLPVFFTTNSPVSAIVKTDLNNDGNIDLAIGNFNSPFGVTILLGDGTGNFIVQNQISTSSFVPVLLITGDFNSDGKPDLAAADVNYITDDYINYYWDTAVYVLQNTFTFVSLSVIPSDTVCANTSLTLTASGATSYVWTDGLTNGVAFPASATHTYMVTGTGTISGCTSSNTITKTVYVNPLPTAVITTQDESSHGYCDGSVKAQLSGGLVLNQWLDSAQTVLSSLDSIINLCPGAYTLHLVDTNSCSNIITQIVHAGALPPTPPICMVTVDSTHTHNIVVWEKTNLDLVDVDSFEVYRETGSNIYQRIGVVSKDSMSTFDDYQANPATTGFRYKLKTKNSHIESLFSDYHNTIYFTNTAGNFSWTPYQVENNGTPVSIYNVYRDDNSTGNFQIIGNTSGNQFGYTDINYTSYPNASYYVEAVMTGGICNPTRSFLASRSNVKHITLTTDVAQLNYYTFNVYPNPTRDNITIDISNYSVPTSYTLNIKNPLGQTVFSTSVNQQQSTINLSALMDKGIYFLTLIDRQGNTIDMRKIVLQ